MSPKPDVEVLVDALADFGAARRLAMVEAGHPAGDPPVGPQAVRAPEGGTSR